MKHSPGSIIKPIRRGFWGLLAVCLSVTAAGASQSGGYHYAGIEYYGSSQLTKQEMEKDLGLKPGANLLQIQKAVERLKQKLSQKVVNSNVEIVSSPPDEVYIAVDVSDSSTDTSAPVRKLKNAHHVQLTSDKPFMLMDQIEARQQKLVDEGRSFSEEMRDGIKYYSDEPCNQIVDQLLQLVPYMQKELLDVVASDPDPNRRRRAVELLSWAGHVPNTCYNLIPAIDDSDPEVRTAVGRYMFPELERLPNDFPFGQLAEAFSRELTRPSHQDRSKALYCLLALCGQHPLLINNIKVFDEEQVRKIASLSVLPSIKQPADKLLQLFVNPPMPPPRRMMMPRQRPDSGF